MAYSLHIEETARVAMARFEAALAPGQLEALAADSRALASRYGLCDSIVDFSGLVRIEIDTSYLRTMANRQPVMTGKRRVLVAPQPEMFGLGRLYGLQQAATTGATEPEMVRTLDEAFAALGLRSPNFVPVVF